MRRPDWPITWPSIPRLAHPPPDDGLPPPNTPPLPDNDRFTFVLWVPVFAVFAFVVLVVIAITRDDAGDRAVWFTAIGAGIAFVGVAIAVVALYMSDVLEKPHPALTIQVPDPAGGLGWVDVPHDSTFTVVGAPTDHDGEQRFYEARVHVRCRGRGVLRWGIINIQVPTEPDGFEITAIQSGSDLMRQYPSGTTFVSGELYPGRTVLCFATISERDYAPGHSYLYRVVVTVPRSGTWPLAAVLDGFPSTKKMTRAWTRADINVT